VARARARVVRRDSDAMTTTRCDSMTDDVALARFCHAVRRSRARLRARPRRRQVRDANPTKRDNDATESSSKASCERREGGARDGMGVKEL